MLLMFMAYKMVNKSNSTDDVKVEENLHENLIVRLYFRKLKRQVVKVISHVVSALTVSEILKFQFFFTLKNRFNVIKCSIRNGIIRWQISKSLKVVLCIFFAGSHHFGDINILKNLPSKSRSRSQSTIFVIISFDGKYQYIQKTPTNFCATFTVSEITKF